MRPTPRAARLACLSLALAAFLVRPSFATSRDGALVLRWIAPVDGPRYRAEVVVPGGSRGFTLPDSSSTTGARRVDGLPSGEGAIELRDAQGELLARWRVLVPAGLTRSCTLDLAHRALSVDPACADPFGDWDLWGSDALRLLPGLGDAALIGIEQGPALPDPGLVEGIPLPAFGRINPRRVGLDHAVSGVAVPRGAVSASRESEGREVILSAPPVAPGGDLRLTYGAGGRRLAAGSARAPLPLRWTPEVEAHLQAQSFDDAGPLGIAGAKLDRNDLTALEASVAARFHPGRRDPGAPRDGLVELGMHSTSQERRHFAQEFREDLTHAPKETQARFLTWMAYTRSLGKVELSARGHWRRDFEETGDGRAFDVFDNYDAGGNNRSATADGLYWIGDDPATPYDEGHLFDYYRRDLGSAGMLALEASREWESGAPLRVGLEQRWTAWRHYESLSPIAAGRGDYQGSVSLGYTVDGDRRADPPGSGARRPTRTTLWSSQRFAAAACDVEVGLRGEVRRAGTRPLRSLDRPLGPDDALDRGASASHATLEPRLGLHVPFGDRTHLWIDGGSEHRDPPLEALYDAPAFLVREAYLATRGSLGDLRGYPNGNPALLPEERMTLHVGLLHSRPAGLRVRTSGRVARVHDTWVAREHGAAGDPLLFYENGGERREESLLLEVELPRGDTAKLRVRYTLSRTTTNVIEPAPLYRALLAPGRHAEAASERETAAIRPIWIDDGASRDFFPSLLDRRHQIAAAYTTHSAGSSLASLLSGGDLSLVARGASGLPYTPIVVREEGSIATLDEDAILAPGAEPMSGRGPWSWQIDAAWAYTFPFWRGTRVELGLEGRNLLNHENPLDVYSATGDVDRDGWTGPSGATADYLERLEDPGRFDEGRAVRGSFSLHLP